MIDDRDKIVADKSLGQHFLFDPAVLHEIVDFAGVDSDDVVLEIGPGLGTLTQILTQKARAVIAVEFDKELASKLSLRGRSPKQSDNESRDRLLPPDQVRGRNDSGQLEVINADFLQFDLNQLPVGYRVVANIPYYITAKIVRKLLTAENKPKSATLLVQKEVAERLAATAGDLSILAISAQVYSRVTLGPVIRKNLFTPPPKVDSQVVKMELLDQNLIADIDENDFFKFVKIGFSAPRKKVLKNLANGLHKDPDEIRTAFAELRISENARAEDLSIENWKNLLKILR
ncbi:16S rRNA (adenine(1518)-N(6)/adenine(1519)-N(6))-dimethyltransferase RsmA [Candidatus Saccharibacteria bacterium]|nr:16S rRNA (adenine(1518)-N(6)/adenine(1519)-N(6))-dimethyltransferase RsmA [Candidatus Saccharibacteria bacterium]MCL1963114.1 16S rRNA (adenine(1518)-N(6)/adenine(1519)-N(6))-dimethyltransferase RsmA [Candidatus Saccharibacteria bacterium]